MRTTTFAALLVAGAAVRVAGLPLPGTDDVRVWKTWSYNAVGGVTHFYGAGGDPPVRGVLEYAGERTTVDYPPVALYEMAVVGHLYKRLAPGFPDGPALNAAVKLPGLLAGPLLTAGIFLALRLQTGRTAVAQAGALAYWLNPATILNGEVLGYLDPLVMAPAVWSLILVHRRAFGVAGAALAVTVLTKPQGLLVAPAFAVAAWRTGGRSGLVRAAVTAAVASALIVLPFVIAGNTANMRQAFVRSFAQRDILSGYAANIWWIANYVSRAWLLTYEIGFPDAFLVPVRRILAVSSFMNLGFPNPRPFATIVVIALTGWATWRARHATDLALHAALAAFTVHTYFVVAVGVHENHLMLAVPLLVLAATTRTSFRPIFVIVSVVCALGMNLFYGLGLGIGWAIPRMITPVDLSVILSAVNTAALVWHGRILSREAVTQGRQA